MCFFDEVILVLYLKTISLLSFDILLKTIALNELSVRWVYTILRNV